MRLSQQSSRFDSLLAAECASLLLLEELARVVEFAQVGCGGGIGELLPH